MRNLFVVLLCSFIGSTAIAAPTGDIEICVPKTIGIAWFEAGSMFYSSSDSRKDGTLPYADVPMAVTLKTKVNVGGGKCVKAQAELTGWQGEDVPKNTKPPRGREFLNSAATATVTIVGDFK